MRQSTELHRVQTINRLLDGMTTQLLDKLDKNLPVGDLLDEIEHLREERTYWEAQCNQLLSVR